MCKRIRKINCREQRERQGRGRVGEKREGCGGERRGRLFKCFSGTGMNYSDIYGSIDFLLMRENTNMKYV